MRELRVVFATPKHVLVSPERMGPACYCVGGSSPPIPRMISLQCSLLWNLAWWPLVCLTAGRSAECWDSPALAVLFPPDRLLWPRQPPAKHKEVRQALSETAWVDAFPAKLSAGGAGVVTDLVAKLQRRYPSEPLTPHLQALVHKQVQDRALCYIP